MERRTIKIQLIFMIILLGLLVFPTLASAQEPTPESPYTFAPVDYEGEPTGINLVDIISSVGFINAMGSYVVTVWAILDDFGGGGVLGFLVIFLLGVVAIRWVAGFVYGKPIKAPEIEASRAIETADNAGINTGSAGNVTNAIKNRPRF